MATLSLRSNGNINKIIKVRLNEPIKIEVKLEPDSSKKCIFFTNQILILIVRTIDPYAARETKHPVQVTPDT